MEIEQTVVSCSFSSSPTPWNGQTLEPAGHAQQTRYTTLPPQTNPPPLPSFPQGFGHCDYKPQENEYESGSIIYGHQNGDEFRNHEAYSRTNHSANRLDHSAVNEDVYRRNDEIFRNDNLYQPDNDEWDRKSCDSNTHSDVCCSCSESSCLYGEAMEYNNQFAPGGCGHNRGGSRNRNNRSPRRRNNRPTSPTYSSESNYSCIPQRQCGPVNSQERLRHNRSKGWA